MLHVFGDSHSKIFEHYEHTRVHWLGPITMHRISRDGINFLDIKKYNVEDYDTVMYVFGEIDVRVHIGKQRDTQNVDLDIIINTLVRNYITTILVNAQNFKSLSSIIMCPVPPTNASFDEGYPYYGSVEDRISITKRLNQLLKEQAALYQIKVLDVYSQFANETGILEPSLSDGFVHIGMQAKEKLYLELDKLLVSQ